MCYHHLTVLTSDGGNMTCTSCIREPACFKKIVIVLLVGQVFAKISRISELLFLQMYPIPYKCCTYSTLIFTSIKPNRLITRLPPIVDVWRAYKALCGSDQKHRMMGTQSSPVKSYDYLLKFLLVGDSDVGKEEILDSLQDGSVESPYAYSSEQGRFCTIFRSYSRGAQDILLVYDITNGWSFDGIDRWIWEIDEEIPFMVDKET
ncbi:uncharacterized protein LOC123969909 [Micropterus dolomieu]|uniref:uncharacterized protein LOC123969909 n=1 Tax=Micropterus dolomieu TaxID=147949 RepID=UPI001E8D22FE|nr:uncharacterized protein LOC123969909 [Micropterus dolomieu]